MISPFLWFWLSVSAPLVICHGVIFKLGYRSYLGTGRVTELWIGCVCSAISIWMLLLNCLGILVAPSPEEILVWTPAVQLLNFFLAAVALDLLLDIKSGRTQGDQGSVQFLQIVWTLTAISLMFLRVLAP